MSNTMTIFAEALIDNRNYKNARINGQAVGVANARVWGNAVKAMLAPAYAIREYRYNHMGDAETVAPIDMTAFFDALRPVIDMIGEVNGAKLDTANMAEEVLARAMKFRAIDITVEMAHARCEYRNAKKAYSEDESEENLAEFEKCKEEVKRLEALPGNCKKIPDMVSESAFVKEVEILFGDAITKQNARSLEEILAEKAAKDADRKARAKARKAAKKAEAKA